MDAGLIAATPMVETPTAIKSTRAQSNDSPAQTAGGNDVAGAGGQSSFADVLQQSSQSLPVEDTQQTPSRTVAMHLLGSRIRDVNGSANSAASRMAASESNVETPADAGTTLAVGAATEPQIQTPADLLAKGSVNADSNPKAGTSTTAAGGATPTKTSEKKVHGQTHLSEAAQSGEALQQQIAPIESSGMTAPVLVAAPQPIDVKTTGTAIVTTSVQELQGGQRTTAKPPAQGGKVLRGESGVSGSASGKGEPTLGDGAPGPDTSGELNLVGSGLPPSLTEHAAKQDVPAESTGLSASSVAMGLGHIAPTVNVSGDTSAQPSTSSIAMHGAVSQTNATPSTGAEHATLVSTPNVLEVGVSSGTHGWVRVRAELSEGGDVSASMKATSEAAFDSLHKELPSISAYLATERVGVSSLVVEHTSSLVGGGADLSGSGMSNAQGDRQSTQADGRQGEPAPWDGVSSESRDADAVLANLTLSGATLPVASYLAGSGGWLSVLA